MVYRVGGLGFQPPRISEVLTKLSRIITSVDNTSVTTYSDYEFHSFANWAEPLTRGLPPPDPGSFCPLSSTEFVEHPPNKIPGYVTAPVFRSFLQTCGDSSWMSTFTFPFTKFPIIFPFILSQSIDEIYRAAVMYFNCRIGQAEKNLYKQS
jgi:hypothetical protein